MELTSLKCIKCDSIDLSYHANTKRENPYYGHCKKCGTKFKITYMSHFKYIIEPLPDDAILPPDVNLTNDRYINE